MAVDGFEFPERFEMFYFKLYESILKEFKLDTGNDLPVYKEYEPEFLKNFAIHYLDEEDILDQAVKMTSQLILIQSLPNANHRSAFMFLRLYLMKHGLYMKRYDEDEARYDLFYKISKHIIEREINHEQFYNTHFMDVHHDMAVKEHRNAMERLLRGIIEMPQSGMIAAEPLQSFIAFLNQSGSVPFSNQEG